MVNGPSDVDIEVGPHSDDTPTSNSTSTEARIQQCGLREKLLAFRFMGELTPSLRRSPRNHEHLVKFEEADSVLPTSLQLDADGPSSRPRQQRQPLKREIGDRPRTSSLNTSKKPKVAPPEKYAHLKNLSDHLGDGSDILDVMFCGINPGQKSATVGHHFAHPTNHFWKCLHRSELTDRLLSASEDHTLPVAYKLGLTNLVDRPSAQAAEIAGSEFTAGVPALLRKIVQKRPRIVCFVGKGIWDSFVRAAAPPPIRPQASIKSELGAEFSVEVSNSITVTFSATPTSASMPYIPTTAKRGRAKVTRKNSTPKAKAEPFVYDLQPYKVVHDAVVRETLFFVVVSTSGLVASQQLPDKVKMFSLLKQRVDEIKKGTLDTSSMTVIPVSNVLS